MNQNQKVRSRISPHDRFMRSVLTNIPVAKEFLERHLPASIQGLVDFSTLEPQKESFIDDKLGLQIADILYALKIQGHEGYVHILLEHASQPDKWLSFRMLKYMVGIMDFHIHKKGHTELPVIYPMVLYTGARPFHYSLDLFDFFESHKELARELLYKPAHLIDLTQMSDAQITRDYFYFSAAAFTAKHIHDANIIPVLRQAFECLQNLEEEGLINYTLMTLQYIVEAGSVPNKQAFAETVTKAIPGLDKERLMRTMAEHWKEEGRQEGIQKGLKEAALRLLDHNIPFEVITAATGFTSAQIRQLRVSH